MRWGKVRKKCELLIFDIIKDMLLGGQESGSKEREEQLSAYLLFTYRSY